MINSISDYMQNRLGQTFNHGPVHLCVIVFYYKVYFFLLFLRHISYGTRITVKEILNRYHACFKHITMKQLTDAGNAADILLQAFGVVIVGGMGSIRGAFIAAILLGMIESFGTYFVPQYPGIFFLIALAVILLIKPEGIMGKEQTA